MAVGDVYIFLENSFYLEIEERNGCNAVWLPKNALDDDIRFTSREITQTDELVVTKEELAKFLHMMAKKKGIRTGIEKEGD